MIRKHMPVASRIAVQKPQEEALRQAPSSEPPSTMLAMLEALAAAMEVKAESILESENGDRAELRAQFLADVAEAIRTRFDVG